MYSTCPLTQMLVQHQQLKRSSCSQFLTPPCNFNLERPVNPDDINKPQILESKMAAYYSTVPKYHYINRLFLCLQLGGLPTFNIKEVHFYFNPITTIKKAFTWSVTVHTGEERS